MKPFLVTFADDAMSESARVCAESAAANGVDDWALIKTPHLISSRHPDWPWTFKERGCGYWAWKPLIIAEAMDLLSSGILIYADAGIEFINNVSHIIDRVDQDIFLFGNNWEHAHWCKRDIVEAIMPTVKCSECTDRPFGSFRGGWCDTCQMQREIRTEWARFGKQVQASVIFFRVSDYSRAFVKEWLEWCLSGVRIGAAVTFGKDNPEHRDERATWSEFRYLIDDSPSVFPNHPEFRENRHDQAILTTLAYREGIKLHYWPASYNDGKFVYEKLPVYASDNYPVMFNHHRKRNHEWAKCA